MATPGSAALTARAEDKETTTRYWLDGAGNVYYSRGSAPCLCDAAPAPALEYTDLGRAKDMRLQYSTPPGSPAVTPVASPESMLDDRLDIGSAEKHDENRAWWEQNIRGRVVHLSMMVQGSLMLQRELQDRDTATQIIDEILQHPNIIAPLMKNLRATHVVRAALDRCTAEQAVALWEAVQGPSLRNLLGLTYEPVETFGDGRDMQVVYGGVNLALAKLVMTLGGAGTVGEQLSKALPKATVTELLVHKSGHRFLLFCLENLPYRECGFLFDAVDQHTVDLHSVCQHKTASTVLQRMLEAARGETSVELARAVAEVCDVSLAKHEFGNYIVQKLLTLKHEPAAAESRKAIQKLRGKFAELSTHRFASNVIEAGLRLDAECRAAILSELLAPDVLEAVACDGCGNYVVQCALAECSEEEVTQLQRLKNFAQKDDLVVGQKERFRKTPGGKRILRSLEKRIKGKPVEFEPHREVGSPKPRSEAEKRERRLAGVRPQEQDKVKNLHKNKLRTLKMVLKVQRQEQAQMQKKLEVVSAGMVAYHVGLQQ